jgi:hypothetical protein
MSNPLKIKFLVGSIVRVNPYCKFISAVDCSSDANRYHGKVGIVKEVVTFVSLPKGYGAVNPPILYYVDFFDGTKSCSGLWISELIYPTEFVDKLTTLEKVLYGVI